MNTDDVISKIIELKNRYIQDRIGNDPAALPAWLGEFSGYASIIYDHYAIFLEKYEVREAAIIKEENARRDELNSGEGKAKVTVTEVEQRVAVRIGELKGKRKKLEQVTKGATLHINTCQSLLKTWGDEAKGIR